MEFNSISQRWMITLTETQGEIRKKHEDGSFKSQDLIQKSLARILLQNEPSLEYVALLYGIYNFRLHSLRRKK